MAARKLNLNPEKVRSDVLMSAARSAVGHVYYNTKLKRTQRKDGLWHTRIDVYEKYRSPNRKFAALLKKEGIEVVVHRLS